MHEWMAALSYDILQHLTGKKCVAVTTKPVQLGNVSISTSLHYTHSAFVHMAQQPVHGVWLLAACDGSWCKDA